MVMPEMRFMSRSKIVITLDEGALSKLDQLVKEAVFPNRIARIDVHRPTEKKEFLHA